MNFEKAKYSINKGIWGTSVGGKETLTSGQNLPGDAFQTPVSKDGSEDITIHFEKGELKGINEEQFDKPTDAIRRLNALAAPYGIGRDIHVGDTIIGLKGRVGLEADAPLMIIKAHHTLRSEERRVGKAWVSTWR